MTFIYLNPYTGTEYFGHVAKTIKELDTIFNYAKKSVKLDGYNIKYLYYNAYGSGFIKNNTIPNDLDFATGVYLGKHRYDNKNGEEIAKNIIKAMNSFETSIIFNSNIQKNYYVTNSIFENQLLANLYEKTWIDSITNTLDLALSDKNYVVYYMKGDNTGKVDVPFIIKPNEILVPDRNIIKLYNDTLQYHAEMPLYEREISIVPEYYVDIEHNGKTKRIEIISESTNGGRLQLKRKLFASCVFVHNFSIPFLKQMPYIQDDEEYLYYRFLSFRRHLQDIKNLKTKNERSPKTFKRLAQITDMISPILEPNLYKEIKAYSTDAFNNRDIRLLNEYANICTNIVSAANYKQMFYQMICDSKIEDMYNILSNITDELEKRKNVKQEYIDILINYKEKQIKPLLSIKSPEEILKYSTMLSEQYDLVHEAWIKAMITQYKDPEKINKYIEIFSQKFVEAGIHPIEIYWLNKNNVGILENDFTKNIKDIKEFVKTNDLADINYKIIKQSEIPEGSLSSVIYVSYKPTEQEQKNLAKIKKQFLDDKKNFKIKRKVVWIKNH